MWKHLKITASAKSFGDRAYYHAPMILNALTASIRYTESTFAFRKALKTLKTKVL